MFWRTHTAAGVLRPEAKAKGKQGSAADSVSGTDSQAAAAQAACCAGTKGFVLKRRTSRKKTRGPSLGAFNINILYTGLASRTWFTPWSRNVGRHLTLRWIQTEAVSPAQRAVQDYTLDPHRLTALRLSCRLAPDILEIGALTPPPTCWQALLVCLALSRVLRLLLGLKPAPEPSC